MSSDENPNPINEAVKNFGEGVAKGTLNWSLNQLKKLIEKFRNKSLAFIQDSEIIKLVKQQYNSGESKFYVNYVKNKELLLLVRMGLTLRNLSSNKERKDNLRDKIFKKYEVRGLHIAQFVENGLLNRYCGLLIEGLTSLEDFQNKISDVLNNIEKHVTFVQASEKERNVIQSTVTKIRAHSPNIFVVSGISHAAEIVRKSELKLIELLNDYELEKISSGEKENLFFKRKLTNE